MMMRRRNRGFKLGRKIIRVFKWVTQKSLKSHKYQKLEAPTRQIRSQAISKLFKWGKNIRQGIFSSGATTRGYIRVTQDSKNIQVPKGHLAVYVGDPEGDTRRVFVPVLFLNHPLFGKLLKEAEDVYGFDHPGRITIPCPISEFEYVQTRIAAGGGKCPTLIHRQR